MIGECIFKNVKIYDVSHNDNGKSGNDLIEWWSADVKVGSTNAQTVTIDKKYGDFKPVPSNLYDLVVDVSEQTRNGYKVIKFKVVKILESGKDVIAPKEK